VANRSNEDIDKRNALIKEKVSAFPQVTVLDLAQYLQDECGNLATQYTIDGLHLSLAGYLRVAEQLKKYI
jgi:lysophospholipase L1-like esterase